MVLSIQILRAISATIIIIYHVLVNQYDESASIQVLRVGVDVFFVISGYIIARSTEKAVDPVRFLARRFLRIYPVWWAALILSMLIAVLAFGESFQFSQIVTSITLIISWNERYQNFTPIYHVGWSLSYEVLFYTVWALSIAIASRARLRPLVVAIVLIGGTVVCARLGFKLAPDARQLLPYTSYLLLEFLAGAVIRQAERSGLLTMVSRAIGQCYPWVGVGGSLVGLCLIAAGILPMGLSAAMAILTVLAFLAMRVEPASVGGRLGVYLGDASYSIYLFHAIFLDTAFARTGLLVRGEPNPINAVIAFATCFAFSLAMYHLVEKPCILFGRHLTAGWRHPLQAAQPRGAGARQPG